MFKHLWENMIEIEQKKKLKKFCKSNTVAKYGEDFINHMIGYLRKMEASLNGSSLSLGQWLLNVNWCSLFLMDHVLIVEKFCKTYLHGAE